MDVVQAIRERHSIRAFTGEPVSRDALDRIVAAAVAAPSVQNSQPWFFHIATGETRRRAGEVIAQSTVFLTDYMRIIGPEKSRLLEAFYAELGGAPVVIAVSCPRIEEEHDRVNELLSVGAAIENLLLAVVEEGLGACSITFPYWVRDQLVDLFAVPEDREVVSLIVLGHPGEEPVAPTRRTDVAAVLE
jgi:nitroreductase